MNGEGLIGMEVTTRDVSYLAFGQRFKDLYLWVPINGPGSILSLFASVIVKTLRSIQFSPMLVK